MREIPAFWLACDDNLPLAWRVSERSRLRNSIKHSILHEGRLLVSDSMVVTNRNLRALATEDAFIRGCFAHELVLIARRQKGRELSFEEIRDDLVESRRAPETNHFPADEFADNKAFEFLEKHARAEHFHLTEISTRFTNKAAEILRSGRAVELFGQPVVDCIASFIDATKKENKGNIGMGHLWYRRTLGQHLESEFGPKTWTRHRRSIRNLVLGVYVTGIPDLLETNAVYERRHKRAVDLWRSRGKTHFEPLERRVRLVNDYDLTTYVRALDRLSLDDILALRHRDEWRHYRAAQQALESTGDYSGLLESQLAWRRVVELEIIARLPSHERQGESRSRIDTGIVRMASSTKEWFSQKVYDFFDEKLTGFGLFGLARHWFQKPPEIDAKNPGRLRAQVEDDLLARTRKKLAKQEKIEPQGRIRSLLQYDEELGRDTFSSTH